MYLVSNFFKHINFNPKNKKAFILGAGGVVTITYCCIKKNEHLKNFYQIEQRQKQ